MEIVRGAWKCVKAVPAFFWGAVVAVVGILAIWFQRRSDASHKDALEEIRRDADADRADSDRLVEDKDTDGMRDKWLDPENWT